MTQTYTAKFTNTADGFVSTSKASLGVETTSTWSAVATDDSSQSIIKEHFVAKANLLLMPAVLTGAKEAHEAIPARIQDAMRKQKDTQA